MTATTRSNRALGGIEACLAIARVTFKRASRGAALWVVLGMSLIPELVGVFILEGSLANWDELYWIWLRLMSIVVPVLLASAISEEIEEKTMAYLWSRPLPRWSIIAGKMIALIPVAWVGLALALVLPFYTLVGSEASSATEMLMRNLVSVVFVVIGAAAVTAGLSTLAPRFATVLAMAYLLFIDGPLGSTDASINRLTVSHNAKQIAGIVPGDMVTAIGWMLAITAIWMAVAVWRVRRIE